MKEEKTPNKKMKTSKMIEFMKDENEDYSSKKAKDLYKKGINYHTISVSKWIGFIKGKYKIGLADYCGYCFKFHTCTNCPLNETMRVRIGNSLFNTCTRPKNALATLKNIIKHRVKNENDKKTKNIN